MKYAPHIVGGVIVAILSLYFYFALHFAGTSTDSRWPATLRKFWEIFLFSLPGGMNRKIAALKKRMFENSDENIHGEERIWTQKEVRDENLFEECAKDLFISPVEFWVTTVIVLIFGFALGWGIVIVL